MCLLCRYTPMPPRECVALRTRSSGPAESIEVTTNKRKKSIKKKPVKVKIYSQSCLFVIGLCFSLNSVILRRRNWLLILRIVANVFDLGLNVKGAMERCAWIISLKMDSLLKHCNRITILITLSAHLLHPKERSHQRSNRPTRRRRRSLKIAMNVLHRGSNAKHVVLGYAMIILVLPNKLLINCRRIITPIIPSAYLNYRLLMISFYYIFRI